MNSKDWAKLTTVRSSRYWIKRQFFKKPAIFFEILVILNNNGYFSKITRL